MPQNQARAPFLAEGFPMVPSTQPGNTRSKRSHREKQNKTKQTKQTKQTTFLNGRMDYILTNKFEKKFTYTCNLSLEGQNV